MKLPRGVSADRVIRALERLDYEVICQKGSRVRLRHEGLQLRAKKRLRILDSATSPGDLAALNSNRLEALKGNRKGQYSIRINDQWRVCFMWPKDEPGPSNVEIVDYH
jgi:toxin HigB-1